MVVCRKNLYVLPLRKQVFLQLKRSLNKPNFNIRRTFSASFVPIECFYSHLKEKGMHIFTSRIYNDTQRGTHKPAAWWRADCVCCQLLVFQQKKDEFHHRLSHFFVSRPISDTWDSGSESCYGNQGPDSDYVLPLHTDTQTLLLSSLTYLYFHLCCLSVQAWKTEDCMLWDTPGDNHPVSVFHTV